MLKYDKGFTLAEVLITLAVIGIVSVLTIPALVQNYKKREVESKLLTFYSTMNNALRLSEIDNGAFQNWPFVNGTMVMLPLDVYNKYWKQYLKVNKVRVLDNDDDNGILLYFANGSLVRIDREGREYEFYVNSEKYSEKRDKAKMGIDVFMFRLSSDDYYYKNIGLEPYNYEWNGVREELFTSSPYGCKKENTQLSNGSFNGGNFYCTLVIQQNGWKIPDDYPLRF